MRSSSWLQSGKEGRNNHQNRCNDEDGDGDDDDGDGNGDNDDEVLHFSSSDENIAAEDDVDNDLVMSRGSSNPDFAAWVPLEFSLGAPSY